MSAAWASNGAKLVQDGPLYRHWATSVWYRASIAPRIGRGLQNYGLPTEREGVDYETVAMSTNELEEIKGQHTYCSDSGFSELTEKHFQAF